MEGGKKEPPHRNAGGTIAYKTKTKTGVKVIKFAKTKIIFLYKYNLYICLCNKTSGYV